MNLKQLLWVLEPLQAPILFVAYSLFCVWILVEIPDASVGVFLGIGWLLGLLWVCGELPEDWRRKRRSNETKALRHRPASNTPRKSD